MHLVVNNSAYRVLGRITKLAKFHQHGEAMTARVPWPRLKLGQNSLVCELTLYTEACCLPAVFYHRIPYVCQPVRLIFRILCSMVHFQA